MDEFDRDFFEREIKGFEKFREVSDTEAAKYLREMLTQARGVNTLAVEPAFGSGSLDKMMYIGSCDGSVYAVDISDRKILWQFHTGGTIVGSLVVHNNVVYVGSNDHIFYAVDARNGSELWRFTTGDIIQMKPLVLSDKIIFGSFDRNVYAFSLAGKELWRLHLDGFSVSEPLFADEKIFLGTTDGHMNAFSLDGEKLWSHFAGNTNVGAAAVADLKSIIFATWDGNVCRLFTDGTPSWKFKCDGSVPQRYRCQVDGDTVYVGDGDLKSGTVYSVGIADGRLIWKLQLNGRSELPRSWGSLLMCPSLDGNLYALDRSGHIVWKFKADGALGALPTFKHGLLFICSHSGNVYCLDNRGVLVWKIFFPGRIMSTERAFSPVQRLSEKIRSLFKFWSPERAANRAYETPKDAFASLLQVTLGPAAYKLSEPYRLKEKYKSSVPNAYVMKPRGR